jgi:peptidoglycan hydrolase-like protein with peptidoglycan-binding domain
MVSIQHAKLPMIAACVLLTSSLALASPPPKKHSTHAQNRSGKVHHSSKKSQKSRSRGQQAIDTQRTTQIQQALLREHYLSGEPSGNWDAATQEAMRRYQADQGWQSKTVPDSRALIRLGLGPSHDRLLNPESAMVSGPAIGSVRAPIATQSSVLPGNRSSSAAVSVNSDLSSSR